MLLLKGGLETPLCWLRELVHEQVFSIFYRENRQSLAGTINWLEKDGLHDKCQRLASGVFLGNTTPFWYYTELVLSV